MTWADRIWLAPLAPLVAAGLLALAARPLERRGRLAGVLATLAVAAAFAVSLAAVAGLQLAGATSRNVPLGTWFGNVTLTTADGRAMPLAADFALQLDPLSGLMALLITGVGLLVHVYALGYMDKAAGQPRFYAWLGLFVALMLTLVLADNYLLLFAGWEGVGLCSYGLIGFHRHRPAAGGAALKAFVVNRVGDAGLLLGIVALFAWVGSARYADVDAAVRGGTLAGTTATALALLLLVGAAGKSAQVPLSGWLPNAMEAPTPVSALIHAATMVTAGVYLLARAHLLFAAAPMAAAVAAIGGAITALVAATAALAQTDIKRVLAYSTVSQLGYLFMALGAGATWVAMFHLATHAFAKALLFLGAGCIIHLMNGEQDIRRMGGLRRAHPLTHATMLLGALSLAGVPGLAGFFSKDALLARLYHSPVGYGVLYAVGLATALLTATYLGRLLWHVFYRPASTPVDPHHPPVTMTLPLALLAVASVLSGWLGVPTSWTAFGGPFRSFEAWLAPVFQHLPAPPPEPPATEWTLMGLSVAAALGGLVLARAWFARRGEPARWPGLLTRGWYLDDALRAVFVRGVGQGGGRLLARLDATGLDGVVRGATGLAQQAARAAGWWDGVVVDGAVGLVGWGVRLLSYPVRAIQTGYVQAYALAVAVGALALLGVFLWQ